MSYSYTVAERRRRTVNLGYGASGSRSTFGYWVPLALTVTAATIGIAAWIWSERGDDEEDTSEDEHSPGNILPPGYTNMSGALPPGPGPAGFQGPPGQIPGPPIAGGFQGPPPSGAPPAGYAGNEEEYSRSTAVERQEDTGLVARMSSALGMGRASSPAQSYDWASKKVVAGVAAAGAMVGGALSSLRDGDREGYEDHERWSEEAEQRDNGRSVNPGIKRRGTADEFFSGKVDLPKRTSLGGRKRRTVAIVVSAVELNTDDEYELGHHAVSLLLRVPRLTD